jgi:hypothetical protein
MLKFHKLGFKAIKISVDRWHGCLDHPSRDIVRRVISKNNLPCAAFDNFVQSMCDACACAKAHQLTYPVSSSCSSALLELIFSDVWGPAIESFGHKKYYVPLLMITVNSPGYICCVTSLMFSHISLNFSLLLSACLIRRSLQSNPTGVESMSISTHSSINLASLTKCPVLTLISRMVPQSVSTAMLLRWASLSSLMSPCRSNIGMKHFLQPPIS